MGKRWGLVLLLATYACTQTPAPKTSPAVTHVADPSEPKYLKLPHDARDWDLLCVDWNMPGTCATVGEVRAFLLSRKAE